VQAGLGGDDTVTRNFAPMSRVRVAAAGSVQLLRSQPVSRCLHTVVARGALLLLTTFASVCVLCLECRKHRVVVTVFGEI
jgi:hypothetical protein